MLVKVYYCDRVISGSVFHASLLEEVETDEFPDDEEEFAARYGGDIIVVEDDYDG